MKLHKPKHLAPRCKRHLSPPLLCLPLLAFATCLITMALLTGQTNQITNVFEGVRCSVTVEETFTDGDTVKNDVWIANTGDVTVYLRATLIAQAQDENGQIISNPVVESKTPSEAGSTRNTTRAIRLDDFKISPIGDGNAFSPPAQTLEGEWLLIEGVYYYTLPVPAGEKIPFFASATLKSEVSFPQELTPVLIIMADGIQPEGIILAEENPWPAVKILPDGSLAKHA